MKKSRTLARFTSCAAGAAVALSLATIGAAYAQESADLAGDADASAVS